MKETITIDDKMAEPPKSILEKSLADYDKSLNYALEGGLQATVIAALFLLYDEQENQNEILH